MLVAAGADPNATDSRGYQPAHSAAECDFRLSYDPWARDVVEWLRFSQRVDLAARTATNMTVLDIARGMIPNDPCEFIKRDVGSGYCRQL